jgi:ElaB/YqjD/DUF883 family membrane-anchored ribosome-binding protein
MKKKIINGLLIAVVLVAATSSFVSCKDYDADNYNELQAKYLSLQDAFNKQVAAMQDYVLTSKYNQEVGANYDVNKGTIKQRLDDIEAELDPTNPNSLAEQVHKNNEAILSLGDTLEHFVFMWGDDLKSAYANAGKAKQIALSYDTDTAAINTAIKNAKDVADYAKDVADKAWNYVNQGLAKDKDGNTKEDFQAWVKYFEEADNALADDIAALQQDAANILKFIQQEVTGIEIQATYNPIFGTFSYPIGVQSNILGAYYGICGVDFVKFPASDATEAQIASWATKAPAITRDELEAIYDGEYFTSEKDSVLMVEGKDNAGKLYLTVNPSNVKFDDSYFTLRASDNTVSKVELSPVKACTEQLKWGYNRAAAENSSNGFYVATAQIKKDVVNDVALSFNLKGMAKQIQSMMSDWSKTSASDIAKLALTIHDGLKTNVPRLGVQYQWQDAVSGDWKNYVSKYDIAAVSVKPLGFDALLVENEDGTVVPMDFSQGIVKFKNKLTAKEQAVSAELINKIAKLVAFKLNLGAITQENIEITPDGKIYVIVSSATKPLTLTIAAGSLNTTPAVPSVDKQLKIEDNNKINITPLFDEINKAIQTKLAEVQNEANGSVNKVLNKILDIENKIFGKVESVAKNLNRYVQPALIGKCNQFKGYFYPSRDYLAPTQVQRGQKIMFYPTTLTGEIVAPAFKKYVAISGVWKVSDISSTDGAKAANDAVNAAAGKKYLNTVFDGAEFNIQNGFEINTGELKAGYVYEFIYECLGYNGKVAGKKYYIEVYE